MSERDRSPAERVAIMQKADVELAEFEKWFATPVSEGGSGNSGLSRFEKAILKTYIIAKIAELFPSSLEEKSSEA